MKRDGWKDSGRSELAARHDDDDDIPTCARSHLFAHSQMLLLYSHIQYHNDTKIKTQEDFFIKIYTSHFIVTFVWEKELETEHNCNILTPTLMAVSVVSFSFSRAAQPEAQGSLCRLSLLHLISNISGPQLIRGSKIPFGLTWLSLPHLVSITPTDLQLSWLSYIIVQRPLNRLLDLWNGMFDRHQAEITVMQFTGHYLPVYQSMSVSWDFLPCPISSAKHAHAISFDYWPLKCVTSFRCITL